MFTSAKLIENVAFVEAVPVHLVVKPICIKQNRQRTGSQLKKFSENKITCRSVRVLFFYFPFSTNPLCDFFPRLVTYCFIVEPTTIPNGCIAPNKFTNQYCFTRCSSMTRSFVNLGGIRHPALSGLLLPEDC